MQRLRMQEIARERIRRRLERARNDPARLAELARLRAEGHLVVEVPGVTIIIKLYL